MPAPKDPNPQNTEVTVVLTLSAPEMAQLQAFAALHGESVVAFLQRVALEAAGAAPNKTNSKSRESDTGALWLTDDFSDALEPQQKQEAPDPFAPVAVETIKVAPVGVAPAPAKKGVAGEQSQLAKGHGLVCGRSEKRWVGSVYMARAGRGSSWRLSSS